MKKIIHGMAGFLLPVTLAGSFFFIAPSLQEKPQKSDVAEKALKAKSIKAPEVNVAYKTLGYGKTQPVHSWEAVAQVAGSVSYMSDALKSGEFVAEGTELLRIDDAGYQLAIVQAETQLAALDTKDQTSRASLRLEEKAQSLLNSDLLRKQKLSTAGTISDSVFEESERALIKGAVTVQALKNNLALNKAERLVVETQLKSAQLDLLRTKLVAPFDIRITEVAVGPSQYANRGQPLFSADDTSAVEIEARFPVGQLRALISAKNSENKNAVAGAMSLDAKVRLQTATHKVEWLGVVDRAAGLIDPDTQTIGVIVRIDNPYKQAVPGQRPGLLRNTFVEVELSKVATIKQIVIPKTALRGGQVYVLGADNRLEKRDVKLSYQQGDFAVVESGLKSGEVIIVSSVPGQSGMLLDTIEDEKVLKMLKMSASGKKGSKK